MEKEKINELRRFAENIRIETIKCIGELGFGHIGGSMSIVELLAVLYGHIMNIDPKNPGWEERDWLVVSKGHAGPAVYAALALKGYFPMQELKTLNKPETRLPSHCDRLKTVGIDMTTGSLGQGISTALGVAMGNRFQGRDSYVFAIVGDGECNEGQIWEAALFAPHFKMDNFILFIDNNKQQLDGPTKDIMNIEDIEAKFKAFNWFVQRINGHDVEKITNAVISAKQKKGVPSAIVLDTIKGYGCTFAEGITPNHHIFCTKEQVNEAVKAVENSLARI